MIGSGSHARSAVDRPGAPGIRRAPQPGRPGAVDDPDTVGERRDIMSTPSMEPAVAMPGLERIARRRVTVGLVAGGLGVYWPQFPELLPQLQRSAARVSERMKALDCDVVDVG